MGVAFFPPYLIVLGGPVSPSGLLLLALALLLACRESFGVCIRTFLAVIGRRFPLKPFPYFLMRGRFCQAHGTFFWREVFYLIELRGLCKLFRFLSGPFLPPDFCGRDSREIGLPKEILDSQLDKTIRSHSVAPSPVFSRCLDQIQGG